MSLLRPGLWLATLMLSACSLPVIENNQPTQLDIITPNTTTTEQGRSSPVATANTSQELLDKLDSQSQLANKYYLELKQRLGDAPRPPKLQAIDSTDADKTSQAIQRLRSYNSKASVDISSLDARVTERQKMALSGDLIQILVSDVKISNTSTQFNVQSLVGQWTRGESRVIRLKENFLLESPQSEDLKVTYSENYQLSLNDQVIASVNPEKEKNNATFDVQTKDKSGTITGKLDYRIINKK